MWLINWLCHISLSLVTVVGMMVSLWNGLIVLLLLLWASSWGVDAWGPYTHQNFGLTLQNISRGGLPETDISSPYFQLGASSPDAVKKARSYMHTPEFAGYLVQYSRENHLSVPLQAFALGYGTHLAQDQVGHHANSFLNPKYDHPIEINADTLVYKEYTGPAAKFPFQQFTDEIMDLLVQGSAYYAQKQPGNKPISLEEVQAGVKDFRSITDLEEIVLTGNSKYLEQMAEQDTCGKVSQDVARAHFNLASSWSLQASQTFMQDMITPGRSPEEAAERMRTFVEGVFAGHGGSICV